MAHRTAPETMLVRFYSRATLGHWVSLGSLVMTAAEWKSMRDNLRFGIAAHEGTPLFGDYYGRKVA